MMQGLVPEVTKSGTGARATDAVGGKESESPLPLMTRCLLHSARYFSSSLIFTGSRVGAWQAVPVQR
jgi:hypothetical protein